MSTAPYTLLGPDSLATLLALARSVDTDPAAPSAAFAEVGVYRGGVAWHLAALARQRGISLHLFDTFTGIPERDVQDTKHGIGEFGDTSLDAVRNAIPDAIFHVGVFPATLPPDLGPLAFVHVDCDQYAATRAAIRLLYPLLIPGGVMLFDDYDCVPGARQAVDEMMGDKLHLTAQGKAYVVKVTA